MDLDALVRRFQKKDIIAFEKLYEMYWENVCAIVFAVIRNKSLAEEITQDVFAKIWKNSDSYNPSQGRFLSWLVNTARMAASDELRSKTYSIQKRNISANYLSVILERPPKAEGDIDVKGLKKLSDQLAEKCLQILSLIYFYGYTPKETSEELGITVALLKTKNKNCITQLRNNITLEWT